VNHKLERLALKYRIDLTKDKEPDQQSVTTRVYPNAVAVPVLVQTISLQAERQRLERELQQARQRLNEFQVREREQRRAERARLN